MKARHSLDCTPSLTHGNIVQRVMFSSREADPTGAGAVLNRIDSFARGSLEPGVRSVAHVNEGMQEVFFVASGGGSLIADGHEHRLREGDGILVPPVVEHAFRNDGDRPLELLIVEESIPPGTRAARSSVLIRNYRESDVSQAHWHYLSQRVFGPEDGMARLRTVLVVRLEPMTTGDTHGHGTDLDEVWYMWKGCGIHRVDREIRLQKPGMAIQVAPSDPGHSLMNHTDEPLQAFYFQA